MDLSNLGLFSGLAGKMDWLIQRQKVIAGNIADADTPGHQAQDLMPFTFKSILNRLAPAVTSPLHIQLASSAAGEGAKASSSVKSAYEVKPDGNAVSTEQEIAKAANTAADYQLMSNIYKSTLGMIKQAIGTGGA